MLMTIVAVGNSGNANGHRAGYGLMTTRDQPLV